jgi:hypothetical protein
VEFLADLRLLAEVEVDSSLVKLEFILEKGMIESLERMFGPLVNLGLKHVEEKKPAHIDSPMFLLQMPNEG